MILILKLGAGLNSIAVTLKARQIKKQNTIAKVISYLVDRNIRTNSILISWHTLKGTLHASSVDLLHHNRLHQVLQWHL